MKFFIRKILLLHTSEVAKRITFRPLLIVQNQGKKRLSYKIKGYKTATYILMTYMGIPKLKTSLDVVISRDTSILRHITTKVHATKV